MAILTRNTSATGVTNNGATLTQNQLDNNFVELVAVDATKAGLATANTFTQPQTIATTTNTMLSLTRSSGSAYSYLQSLAGNGDAYWISKAHGTGNAGLIAEDNVFGQRGYIKWDSSYGCTVVVNAVDTAYSINASRRHDWVMGAGQAASFQWGSLGSSNYIYLNTNAGASASIVMNWAGAGSPAVFNYAAANVDLNKTFTFISDERTKENILPVDSNDCLRIACSIDPVTYNRKDSPERIEIGVIAQNVDKVLPEAIHQTEEGLLSVNYTGMLCVALGAVKELNAKIESLEARLAALGV